MPTPTEISGPAGNGMTFYATWGPGAVAAPAGFETDIEKVLQFGLAAPPAQVVAVVSFK